MEALLNAIEGFIFLDWIFGPPKRATGRGKTKAEAKRNARRKMGKR